jgi:hypothetical protein
MTDPSTTFSEPISTVNDLSIGRITENVVSEEPPSYESIYPESINYPNTSSAIHQSQSELRYNINSTSVFIDPQLTITQSTNKIKSYLIWSIFNICCCWCCVCLGCVACYYSSKTNDLKIGGDIQGALNASKKARIINIIATVIGIIIIFFYYY